MLLAVGVGVDEILILMLMILGIVMSVLKSPVEMERARKVLLGLPRFLYSVRQNSAVAAVVVELKKPRTRDI